MNKTGMKKYIHTVFWILFVTLLPGLVLTGLDMALPAQYDETYYGELADMYERLRTAEGKKIILIGGSSLAFGVHVSFLENELEDYTICNFGLYGAIGTRAMLDLAEGEVKEGDIVVIAPELSEQTMSLYFSPKDMWRAVDSDWKLLKGVHWENAASMVNTYSEYVSDKLELFFKGKKPQPSGVYAHYSFDQDCSMTFDRSCNIMPQMYDAQTMISFSPDLIKEEFIAYLNEFYQTCLCKGAQVYYNFCPVNRLAVLSRENEIEMFYIQLNEGLKFPILGNPSNYIFDEEWFYDSNFHMNTAGMVVYSKQLLEDLKLAAEIDSVTKVELPEKPTVVSDTKTNDKPDEELFLCEQIGNSYQITGVTEKGSKMEELRIPTSVSSIRGKSFENCSNLKRLIIEAKNPDCAVDAHLLDGIENTKIILTDYESYLNYAVNYYWSQYAQQMSYEK